MKNKFTYCPNCSSRNVQTKDGRKWVCPECGFELFNNVAAAVGIIIYDKEGSVLFEVRAKNPRKGFLALPGGFVDADESAESAIIRECREEIGVSVDNVEFLCTNPNTYEYKNIEYKTCDIFFAAKLPDSYKNIEDFIKNLKRQESEVEGFVSKKVTCAQDVDSLPLAFESAVHTLKKWLEVKNES